AFPRRDGVKVVSKTSTSSSSRLRLRHSFSAHFSASSFAANVWAPDAKPRQTSTTVWIFPFFRRATFVIGFLSFAVCANRRRSHIQESLWPLLTRSGKTWGDSPAGQGARALRRSTQ